MFFTFVVKINFISCKDTLIDLRKNLMKENTCVYMWTFSYCIIKEETFWLWYSWAKNKQTVIFAFKAKCIIYIFNLNSFHRWTKRKIWLYSLYLAHGILTVPPLKKIYILNIFLLVQQKLLVLISWSPWVIPRIFTETEPGCQQLGNICAESLSYFNFTWVFIYFER